MAGEALDEPSAGPLLVSATSVAEAEARAAELLSPHRLRIGRGRLEAQIHGTSLGSVALYRLNYGAAVTVTGPPLDGYLGTLLPLRGAVRVTHGPAKFEIIAQRSAAVITSRSPMVLEWTPDLDMLLLRVDTAPLERFARNLIGRDDVERYVDPQLADASVFSGLLGSARLIQFAATQFCSTTSWPSSIAARIREQVMLATLLAQPALREHMLRESRQPVSHKAVDAAVDVVNADPTRHLSTAGLAAAVGVSVRALQVGFREVLDVTPHSYMLSARLRRARDELLTTDDSSASVTAIARRWGFLNVGRFAAYYEQAYGEKPSETLRRS
jgi:AraC-like DNA-binding protein